MTSFSLALWIVLGITLQLVIYLGIRFWRHWMNYQRLRSHTEDLMRPSAVETAWSGFRTFRVDRKITEDVMQSVCSFYLVPEDRQSLSPFLPGQFLTFRLDVPTTTDSREQIVRCYSLSDAPQRDHYRISIKRVPPPKGSNVPPGRSSNFFHDQITVGSLLQVRAPSGHFYLEPGDSPLVLIAGGIGITPLLSMLNWSLANQPKREIWLFYGVRNGRELVMNSHLKTLEVTYPNFHLWRCFSDPLPEDKVERNYQNQGRIDINLLRMQLPLNSYQFYICGPTPMMESLVHALENWGVPDAHIHFEAFGPASIKRRTKEITALRTMTTDNNIVVTFAQSGKQVLWQSTDSLLDFAEANNIAINSGCRAGGCGTCQTTIRTGEVSYHQPPDFDPKPGTCLLCVCVPKTSVTLEV